MEAERKERERKQEEEMLTEGMADAIRAQQRIQLEKKYENQKKIVLELEQQLSDRRVELADEKTVSSYVSDLHNLLSESSLAEKKSFVRSFIKEVKVTGDSVLLTYTIPILPTGITEEKLPVLSIVHYGGPKDTFAKPKVETFFDLTIGNRID